MNAKMNDENKGIIKEMLFEDYRYLKEAFWKNESIGETRINFFITLVTASLAAMVALVTASFKANDGHKNLPDFILLVILLALCILLGTGIITLARLIKRNKVTDGYQKDMDNIRELFKEKFDNSGILDDYYLFGPKNKPGSKKRTFGGLKDLMIFFNSIIFTLLCIDVAFLICKEIPILIILILFVLVFFASWVTHELLIDSLSVKSSFYRLSDIVLKRKYSHAGGIVFRKLNEGEQPENDDRLEYLIVTNKKEHQIKGGKLYLFPRGHIKDHEKSSEAAIREVKEETGIVAKRIKPIGSYEGKSIIRGGSGEYVKLYLMECLQREQASENRDHYWLSFIKAYDQLSFPDSKRILIKAHMWLLRHS